MRSKRGFVFVVVASLVGLPGCLFLTEVNERPSASLVATKTAASLGDLVELDARLDDDQAGADAEVRVRDADGLVVDDPCIADLTRTTVDVTTAHLLLRVWKEGTFTVEVTPIDRLGARGSTATVQLTFANLPPAFTSTTAPKDARALAAASTARICAANWSASEPIPIRLLGDVADPDAARPPPFSQCSTVAQALVYRFSITAQPSLGGTLGPTVGSACPTERPARVMELVTAGPTVCLYPDPTLSTVTPVNYAVQLTVDDGVAPPVNSDTLVIPVVTDPPACLDGTYPQAGSYVLARDAGTVFQAVAVDGSSAGPTLGYFWSMKRQGESGYTIVAPTTTGAAGGARYTLDPDLFGFAVGERVSLRVEVVDPSSGAVACEPADDRCDTASCAVAPASTCPRRATWELEYR